MHPFIAEQLVGVCRAEALADAHHSRPGLSDSFDVQDVGMGRTPVLVPAHPGRAR